MASFTARAGQFWLDDQPQLIQAGEFHYFRTPADQWPHRLGLLTAAGFNAVAAYIPWLWHQVAEGESDFDGHSHPLRNLAGFLDLAAELGLWIIARPGPYIMAETINEGIPPWVYSRYPQAAFVGADGRVQNIASYLHPDFRACVARWYQAVFEVLTPRQVTRGGRIILVQLDNEMGMIPWVRNQLDTNPDTLARFAADLRAEYGARASARYPGADLTETVRAGLGDPRRPEAARLVEDYRRFYRRYLREYTAFLWSEARTRGLEVPPVINIHGFANGGKTFPIGLSQLIEVMELEGMISATDVYPLVIGEGNFHQLRMVNAMTTALHNPQQALFSIEFQAGGNADFSNGQASLYDLHSRLCLAGGMRAFNHYLFFDGENDPALSPVKRHDWGHPVRKDGTRRAHYARYPKLSAVLRVYGEALILARPQTTTAIGFLLDDFMTEVNTEATQAAARILTQQREVILFDFLARGLALTHRPFRAVELTRDALEVSQLPTLWVMLERRCPAAVQQKLVDYLHQGGRLIIAGRMCVEDFDHAPCTLLKDALGIRTIQSDEAFTASSIQVFDDPEVPAAFVETYTGDFEAVFATRGSGAVVGFTQPLGRGRAMVFGAAMAVNTLDDLEIVNQLALSLGSQPLFELSQWADISLSAGERGQFLFINNYQDDSLETTIRYAGQPLLGGHAVRVPARRGLILPLEWQLTAEVLIHYVTAEIVSVTVAGSQIRLQTEPAEFAAELTLRGEYGPAAGTRRIQVSGTDGVIVLDRNTPP